MLRIGVDGGGTTTRAVIIDENCRVLGRGEAGSSNHYSAGLKRAVRHIERAAAAALRDARLPPESIAGWGMGLAGACTVDEQALLREQLRTLTADKPLVVDEDAAAAQSGAFGGGAGAVCIAGTGSNCFGVNGRGERARADGLGPLLGDRGSGYWVGEEVLRAVCRAFDTVGPSTSLLPAALAHFQIGSVAELVQVVYQPDFTKDRIAGLFPVALGCAAEGDAVAQGILRAAGQQLSATTSGVLNALGIARVAVSGGVLSRDTPVRAAYEDALRQTMPAVEFHEAQYDAAIGAALLTKARAKRTGHKDAATKRRTRE